MGYPPEAITGVLLVLGSIGTTFLGLTSLVVGYFGYQMTAQRMGLLVAGLGIVFAISYIDIGLLTWIDFEFTPIASIVVILVVTVPILLGLGSYLVFSDDENVETLP